MSSHPQELVRTAAARDLPHVAELAAAAVAEKQAQKGGEVWGRREARREPFEKTLAADLEAPDREVVVGLLDEAIVGYGVVSVEVLEDGTKLGVVGDVYVDPGARELGVGELMMDHLLDWCRAEGCFGVDSLALPGDRSTKNFFESFGLVARAIIVHKPL